MTRIGELLLEHGWVDATNLRRALAEQSLAGGKRICSLLIARGLLDPDNAARALGELHDVPAVLQRHLEHRDLSLVQLLPAAIARAHCALPIGRTRGGDLIVCVRDPSHEVEAAVRRTVQGTLVIAVAPAAQLEQLIEESYAPDENEFDVDLGTNTGIAPPSSGNLLVTPDYESSMPDLGSLSLVELDDVRVNKDITTSQAEYKLPQRTTPPPFNAVMPPFDSITPPTQPPAQPPAHQQQRQTLPPRTTPALRAETSPFASIAPSTPSRVDIAPELEPEDTQLGGSVDLEIAMDASAHPQPTSSPPDDEAPSTSRSATSTAWPAELRPPAPAARAAPIAPESPKAPAVTPSAGVVITGRPPAIRPGTTTPPANTPTTTPPGLSTSSRPSSTTPPVGTAAISSERSGTATPPEGTAAISTARSGTTTPPVGTASSAARSGTTTPPAGTAAISSAARSGTTTPPGTAVISSSSPARSGTTTPPVGTAATPTGGRYSITSPPASARITTPPATTGSSSTTATSRPAITRPPATSRPAITTPPATSRPAITPPATNKSTTTPPANRVPIAAVVDALADAVDRDSAMDVAMRFATSRWSSSLLLAVKEGAALGQRGHGAHLSNESVRAIVVPLTAPSIVAAAFDARCVVTEPPADTGAVHERVVKLLGQPRHASAAPILVAGRVTHVFAVGDLTDHEGAGELDQLAAALGEAFARSAT